ncbi:MAG: transporter associated domain-containing protein [Planctomycetota bacterium]
MTATDWAIVTLAALAAAIPFATLQTALRRAGRSTAESIATARHGQATAEKLDILFDSAERHAAALALPRTLFVLITAVAAVEWTASVRGGGAATAADAAIGLSIAAPVIWIAVIVIPVSLARHLAAGIVVLCAPLLRLTLILLAPARALFAFGDEVVRRLAGDSADHTDADTEILQAVEEHEREGKIDETEADMIEGIVELRDTNVEQIMTPRTETVALPYTDDLRAILAFLKDCGHSRLPVYREDLDHIAGLLYAKDLLNYLSDHPIDPANGGGFELEPLLRKPVFFPESKTVRELLSELLAERVHIALVADEYGGTAGLVTIEDIVEEVFGEIRDEHDTEEDEPELLPFGADNRTAELDARMELDDVNELLEPLGLELPESDDYDTLGGFVVVTLGKIPEPGEALTSGPVKLTVLEAEPTRVKKLRVEIMREETAPPTDP